MEELNVLDFYIMIALPKFDEILGVDGLSLDFLLSILLS